MPQKRNPDAAELVRGKTGRVIGALVGMLTVMKGLPLAYSKDMQEDKEGSFDALHALSLCVAAMTGMVRDMSPAPERMKASAGAGFSTATDLADWLVRRLGLPFRQAHHVTGSIVRLASDAGCDLEDLTLAQMQAVEPQITRRGVLGSGRRPIRPQPHQLRRNGARQCRSAGAPLARCAQGTRQLVAPMRAGARSALAGAPAPAYK